MEFEFDPTKSAANHAKHGIDFVAAQALWLDEARLEIPARTEDEPRWLVIGRIDALVLVGSDHVSPGTGADHLGKTVTRRGGGTL